MLQIGKVCLAVSFWLAVGKLNLSAQVTSALDSAFEVATVRIAAPDAIGSNFNWGTKRFSALNVTFKDLLVFAYDLHSDAQIEHLPPWANTARFDVKGSVTDEEAQRLRRLPPEESHEQQQVEVQSLLKARFSLQGNIVKREQSVLALVRVGEGRAIQRVPDSLLPTSSDVSNFDAAIKAGVKFPSLHGGDGHVEATAVTMKMFAAWINHQADYINSIVVDSTEMTGSYSFRFDYADGRKSDADEAKAEGHLQLDSAIKDSLGLALKKRRADVDVFSVNVLSPPSEN